MKAVFLTVLLVTSGWSQVRGGGFRNYGSPSGFGNVLYPGVGTAPTTVFQTPSFAQQLGRNIAGHPVFPNSQRHFAPGNRGVAPIVVPYPVYVGGYGYGYTDPAPSMSYVQPYPQPAPQVIINHNYLPEGARPLVRDYTQTPLPETTIRTYEAPGRQSFEPRKSIDDEKPTIYLVALKDGTIYPAVAYWADGNTVNYVTLQGSHNRVTLDLVDRDLSTRINTERGVEFNLPAVGK